MQTCNSCFNHVRGILYSSNTKRETESPPSTLSTIIMVYTTGCSKLTNITPFPCVCVPVFHMLHAQQHNRLVVSFWFDKSKLNNSAKEILELLLSHHSWITMHGASTFEEALPPAPAHGK